VDREGSKPLVDMCKCGHDGPFFAHLNHKGWPPDKAPLASMLQQYGMHASILELMHDRIWAKHTGHNLCASRRQNKNTEGKKTRYQHRCLGAVRLKAAQQRRHSKTAQQRGRSAQVWALGALSLTCRARMAKRRTWMVAPAAYQNGPDTPYFQATFADWSSVAAHVHCETITEAVSPVLMDRPAVLNSSDVSCVPPKVTSSHTKNMVMRAKNTPKPRITAQPAPCCTGKLWIRRSTHTCKFDFGFFKRRAKTDTGRSGKAKVKVSGTTGLHLRQLYNNWHTCVHSPLPGIHNSLSA
jgi:hypothetical protein